MKKIFSILIVLVLIFSTSSCDFLNFMLEEESEYDFGETISSDETWAIYWYCCGSDLESGGAFASDDLFEMMEIELPENIQIIIQTGGANQWQNNFVDEKYAQRFLYDSEGLKEVEKLDTKNMGASDTLADFLQFCTTNYPADKQAVFFWDHGGGTVKGIAYDEQYDNDFLTLTELHDAFSTLENTSDEPIFELIGFDACLMATIDTAWFLKDFSKYMIASQEVEPALGWEYKSIMTALAKNPSLDGAALGKIICDTYAKECRSSWLDSEITLSVIDLRKIEPLVSIYNLMSTEALINACSDETFFANFGRNATTSENYGGNTKGEGFTNMIDLGNLIRNNQDLLPLTSKDLLTSLDDSVVYSIKGKYRSEATGLSCYYPYDADSSSLQELKTLSASEAIYHLYEYKLTGSLSKEAAQYLHNFIETNKNNETNVEIEKEEIDNASDVPSFDTMSLEDYPVTIDDDGYATLDLGVDITNYLSTIYFQIAYIDYEEDITIFLGQDNDLNINWDTGIIKDNFRGVWGAIDNNLVYMEILQESDDYTLYSVPILLNRKEYNLHVSYDYDKEEYTILGASKGLDENGIPDRNLIVLKPGDEITTIHYAAFISSDEDFEEVEVDTFTVKEGTKFHEMELSDGIFLIVFEMIDSTGSSALSESIVVSIENGEMYVE